METFSPVIIAGTSPRPGGAEQLLSAADAAKLDRLDLRSRRMFAGKLPGERRSKKRGRSVEFADHRQYAPGDDLRFIDWNVYARFDRLFVKLFMEEEDLSLHVVIDASTSMDTPEIAVGTSAPDAAGEGDRATDRLGVNKKLFACRVAAAMAHLALSKQNRVGLTVFGAPAVERPAVLADCRGRPNVPRVMRFLLDSAWPQASGATTAGAPGGSAGSRGGNGFTAAMDSIARSRTGKGVIVVLSDFFGDADEGFEPGLRTLGTLAGGGGGAGGFDVFCVQTIAPAEEEPELLGRSALDALAGDLRLSDAETGRAAEVTISTALIKKYKQRFGAFRRELEQFCAARGMVHLAARTDGDIGELLTGPLRRRGVVA